MAHSSCGLGRNKKFLKMKTEIISIGVYDKNLELFENQYITPEGISYNSYVVKDEKTAVIDTVDKRMVALWQENLTKALNGTAPSFLIVQHLEPDHSSQIKWFMDKYPEASLICSVPAAKMLPLIVDTASFASRITTMNDGDTLSLGASTLRFITAPMIHWPEVMMVYCEELKTLFSADAFGRFGNPDPSAPWTCEARRYYFNIVGKYGSQVQALFKKLQGLDIEKICPLHGPVLNTDLNKHIDLYNTWSTYSAETPGVLVAYASIHGFTEDAALKFADMLRTEAVPHIAIANLAIDDQAEAVEDAFRHSHLVCMSSTYDAGIFPPMHDFIHHLAIKGFRNRTVALVENGLWAPAAARKMKEMFLTMPGITYVEPIITLRGRLTPETEAQLKQLAHNISAQF